MMQQVKSHSNNTHSQHPTQIPSHSIGGAGIGQFQNAGARSHQIGSGKLEQQPHLFSQMSAASYQRGIDEIKKSTTHSQISNQKVKQVIIPLTSNNSKIDCPPTDTSSNQGPKNLKRSDPSGSQKQGQASAQERQKPSTVSAAALPSQIMSKNHIALRQQTLLKNEGGGGGGGGHTINHKQLTAASLLKLKSRNVESLKIHSGASGSHGSSHSKHSPSGKQEISNHRQQLIGGSSTTEQQLTKQVRPIQQKKTVVASIAQKGFQSVTTFQGSINSKYHSESLQNHEGDGPRFQKPESASTQRDVPKVRIVIGEKQITQYHKDDPRHELLVDTLPHSSGVPQQQQQQQQIQSSHKLLIKQVLIHPDHHNLFQPLSCKNASALHTSDFVLAPQHEVPATLADTRAQQQRKGITITRGKQSVQAEETKQVNTAAISKISPSSQHHYVSRINSNQVLTKVVGNIRSAEFQYQPLQQQAQIQTERQDLSSKLSLSQEIGATVRESELSNTMSFIQTTGVHMSLPQGDTGCSPKLNFYPTALISNQQINRAVKRGTSGSSVQVISTNGQKRRQLVKTASCNNQANEDKAHSSPSGGGRQLNNVSVSLCNKSVHYGLSNQSFMSNSNSKGGSNPRQPAQDVGIRSQTGVNTSNFNNSFYTHQRQTSSGAGGNINQPNSNNSGNNSSSNNLNQSNTAHNPAWIVGQKNHAEMFQSIPLAVNGPTSNLANSKKVLFVEGVTKNDSLANAQLSQPLSNKKLASTIDQKVIDKNRTLVGGGAMQTSNRSKQQTKSNNSSRSNSIRKRENLGKVVRKQNIDLKGNYMASTQVFNRLFTSESMIDAVELDNKHSLIHSKHIHRMSNRANNQPRRSDMGDEQKRLIQREALNLSSNQALLAKSSGKYTQAKVSKKKDVNRSVIIEPSFVHQQSIVRYHQDFSTPKDTGIQGKGSPGLPNIQEMETMKQELKSKDRLIQNLRDRLQNLEDKVNGIQEQQHTKQKNIESEDTRDKSQQRIKEAILNLEIKLEQFRVEKEQSNLRLEEMKQYSSSQHSSSRQSEQTMGLNSLGRKLLGNMQAQNTRAQNYFPVTGPSGFAGYSWGGSGSRIRKSQHSLIDDFESLVTIAENEELNAYEVSTLNQAIDADKFFGGRNQASAKIKTPMFEDNIDRLCDQSDDDEIKILAHGVEVISDGQHEEDNSCLIMLEKEWQEAQKLKLMEEVDEEEKQLFLDSCPPQNNNLSGNLFDQSLISANINLKNYNQTHNNIVFFFDEETTIVVPDVGGPQDNRDMNLEEDDNVLSLDDIELAAIGSKDKFIKTQKIELTKKVAKMSGGSSLSPSQSSTLKSRKMLAIDKQGKQKRQPFEAEQVTYSINKGYHQKVDPHQDLNLQPTSSLSRTLSKTALLAKIKFAIGKQDSLPIAVCETGGAKRKTPKQPRRFIVKTSQERKASTSNKPPSVTTIPAFGNPRLKPRTHMLASSNTSLPSQVGVTLVEDPSVQLKSSIFRGGQQEQLLIKTSIVQQKEQIALTQKDALKKERDLSLKLRQAIQKLNFKIQMQQTSIITSSKPGGYATASTNKASYAVTRK